MVSEAILESPSEVNVSEARGEFANIINNAHFKHQSTIVSKHHKPVAAVISFADYRLLQRLAKEEMDRQDLAAAKAALEAGEFTPIEDFAIEMGW